MFLKRNVKEKKICLRTTHPSLGSTAMPLGLARSVVISDNRKLPFNLQTKILLAELSTKYKFFATQSTAIPSDTANPSFATAST